MKPIPDCVPDALNLVLQTARIVSDDPFIHRKVLRKAMNELMSEPDLGTSSPELTLRCLNAAYKALGVKDPYEKEKARRNKAMLGLEKTFRDYIFASPDPLSASLNLVLAGTIRGSEALGRTEMEKQILENLDVRPARDDRADLQKALSRAERVLYVTDTAGEVVLDKLLIEQLTPGREGVAVVSSRPILTLVTGIDAEAVGLGDVAEVVDAGAPMLGLTLEKASRRFREMFDAADVIVARGEMHFETLREVDRDVFFLLQARDETVAERLDVPVNSSVFVQNSDRAGRSETETIGTRESGSVAST